MRPTGRELVDLVPARSSRAPSERATIVRRLEMSWPRASSADLAKPLQSLHLPSGDGAEEAQQSDHSLSCAAGKEALEQRSRNPLLVHERHECGTHVLPERRCHEDLPPPPAPALEA